MRDKTIITGTVFFLGLMGLGGWLVVEGISNEIRRVSAAKPEPANFSVKLPKRVRVIPGEQFSIGFFESTPKIWTSIEKLIAEADKGTEETIVLHGHDKKSVGVSYWTPRGNGTFLRARTSFTTPEGWHGKFYFGQLSYQVGFLKATPERLGPGWNWLSILLGTTVVVMFGHMLWSDIRDARAKTAQTATT